MTKIENDIPPAQQQTGDSPQREVLHVIGFIGACLLGLVVIAFTAGFVAGMTQDSSISLTDMIALGIAFVLLAGVAWVLKRTFPVAALPASPRMRSNRLMLYVSIIVGVLLGIALVAVQEESGASPELIVTSGSPIPQSVAIILIAGMLLATVLSIRWHMLLDEHERAAYDFGGIAALYTYFTLSGAWWLAWRGGMVIAPDGYAIFWTTLVVWMLGWLAKRFF
ncbi:hypothetical protein [Paraurantiacibacter namhicola]|uniref:Uncharacterized protein n=1 Tax=Paraurantiacibacter namhicola TaxID=645517 RepID=A0A1C7D9B3_9SPHN|nr:hypothetical protein [Paraurantiacibacter namhicola]ANU08027.1 hypothetical protein A6F65_01730 [Paraurantiacibacter namhicola]